MLVLLLARAWTKWRAGKPPSGLVGKLSRNKLAEVEIRKIEIPGSRYSRNTGRVKTECDVEDDSRRRKITQRTRKRKGGE